MNKELLIEQGIISIDEGGRMTFADVLVLEDDQTSEGHYIRLDNLLALISIFSGELSPEEMRDLIAMHLRMQEGFNDA